MPSDLLCMKASKPTRKMKIVAAFPSVVTSKRWQTTERGKKVVSRGKW